MTENVQYMDKQVNMINACKVDFVQLFESQKIVYGNKHQLMFVFMQKGRAQIARDSVIEFVNVNELYIVYPGDIVELKAIDGNCKPLIISISVLFFDEIARYKSRLLSILINMRKSTIITLSPNEVDLYLHMVEIVKNKVDETSQWSKESAFSALNMIVFYLFNLYELKGVKQKQKVVGKSIRFDEHYAKFMSLLVENFREQRQVAFYASRMFITSKYLSNIVKQYSGLTASQLIEELVIDEIKKLLVNTQLSIKEISITLNFPSISSMGKSFKKIVGLSPRAYREQNLR